MYCSINNVRRSIKDGKQMNMIYIDDGVYGCLRDVEKWHYPKKFKRSTENDTGPLEEATLWGPSCDSEDRIMQDYTILLPRCVALDWLIFPGSGAYTITVSTRFSCLEIPLIRSVVSLELWNRIKDNEVFAANDFILNPDLSTPLPSTSPPLLQNHTLYERQ
ncbi:ornithine decarboxylase-like [Manduca sexta]|nr:ornithine decarboxylase-like [Manduca sexta]